MRDKFYNLFKFISEYAFYGLLFCIPISISLVEIFVALLFVAFIGRKIIKPDFRFLRFWPNIFLLSFLFFCALSLLNSGQYFNKSIHALFSKWVQYLGICIIIQDSVYDQKITRRGIFIFLCGASLVILSGLSQYFFGLEFLRNKGIAFTSGGARAITSSFAHYNDFGGYLVVVVSIAIALLLADNSFSLRTIILLFFSIFSVATIMLTFSRGSWLALFVSFIFTCMLNRKNFKLLIPIFLVIGAVSLFPVFHERILLAFKSGGDSDRFRYWVVALRMANDHPFFGVGVGTFMANFLKYLPNSFVSYAHNCYLQIWAETGIFALASFMIFIISIVYLGIKKFILSGDFLLLGFLSGVMGLLVHSFFDTDLYSLRLAFLFWAWIGIIISKLRMTHGG